jgi:N6-L-threonylcarbamoyladenine synthase
MQKMRILAIETSCDETAIAIVETEGTPPSVAFRVLADNTLTQIDIHKAYGGVFPMLAKREHARTLVPLLVKTLADAGMLRKTSRHVIESPLRKEFEDILEREPDLFGQFIDVIPEIDTPEIDAIAVTQGPGLEPALWVGINFAKALAMIWKKQVIPVNHMEGHLLAPLLKKTEDGTAVAHDAFPAIGLLVSGGHTELVLMDDWRSYTVIGATRDDAVGEAFDKVARVLGLPYPGGPEIARMALDGHSGVYTLPRPMLHSPDFDFSFAGLKTAVLYLARDLGTLTEVQKADLALAFEEAAVEVLVAKTLRAVEEYQAHSVIVGGGVSANTRLRETLKQSLKERFPNIELAIPERTLSTDNALMIAIAAYFTAPTSDFANLRARGNWKLG